MGCGSSKNSVSVEVPQKEENTAVATEGESTQPAVGAETSGGQENQESSTEQKNEPAVEDAQEKNQEGVGEIKKSDEDVQVKENSDQVVEESATEEAPQVQETGEENAAAAETLKISIEGTLEAGQKVEAVDPQNADQICVASISAIDEENKSITIHFDGRSNDDDFVVNLDQLYTKIYPVGYCGSNSKSLTAPSDYEGEFSWEAYLEKTGAIAAPIKLDC